VKRPKVESATDDHKSDTLSIQYHATLKESIEFVGIVWNCTAIYSETRKVCHQRL